MTELFILILGSTSLPHWEPSSAGLAQRVEAVSAWMTELETGVHASKLRTGTSPGWIHRDVWQEEEVHFGVGSWVPDVSGKSDPAKDVRLAEFMASASIRANGGSEVLLLDWYVEPSGRIWALGAAGPVFRSLHLGMRAPKLRAPRMGTTVWSTDDAQRAREETNRHNRELYERTKLNVTYPIDVGYIPKEIIDRVIGENIKAIRNCAQNSPRKVTMKWVITARGTVVKARPDNSEVSGRAVDCVAAQINRWVFPYPDGGIVEVVRMFDLRANVAD